MAAIRAVVAGNSSRIAPLELGGIRVAYKKHLDGGGREFGQDFIPISAQTRDAAPTARVRMVCRPGLHRLALLGHGLAQNALPGGRQSRGSRRLSSHGS